MVIADSVTPMRAISLAEWQRKLPTYQPDVLVVDMWAMWCTNCIEQFPEMVMLHQRYKNKNVRFVSLNLDDREDTDSLAAANRFLHKMNATFEHYHVDENLMLTFEQLDLIGIPAVFIYDQQGKIHSRLTGDDPNNQFTKEDVEQAILTLLAE